LQQLLAQHDALDGMRTARGAVAANQRGADLRVAFGGLKFTGHSGEKALEHELHLHPDDRVKRPGHTHVRLKRRAAGEDAFIRRGNVRVRAEHGGHAAIEIPAKSDLLARGFAVDVEHDNLRRSVLGNLRKQVVGLAKGVVAGGHKDAPLHVDNGILLAGGQFAFIHSEAGCADSVIGRADDAAAAHMRILRHGHVFKNLFFVPDVVAGRDHVRTQVEELFRNRRRQAEATGGVFAVDDEQVNGVGFNDVPEVLVDDVAAGRAKDVADEEDIHTEECNAVAMRDKLSSMIDLVWNFPLLEEQAAMWREHLAAAFAEYGREPVESQRPSFRTVELKLRERAAAWLGFPVQRTWITCGGHHGTLNALLASGLAGERVAVEGTTYPGFLDQCRLTKTDVVACAIDGDGLIPEALRAACEQARTAKRPITGLFTMPSVQNPMGFVTPLARREEIAKIAREYELKIIEDDAYGFMEAAAPPNYAVLAPERTFYVRGLAKSFSPAVRTGFLVAPESAEAAMVMSLKNTATGTDVLQNMAALAMCEDGTVEQVMEHKRIEGAIRNRESRTLLGASAAPGAPCAWHVWVRLRDGVDGHAVVAAMKKLDVMVSPGDACAAVPEYGRGLRLALGAEIKRERTLEGVARVAEFLRRT